MLTITRKIEWDAGHRVLNHEGHCKHLHGHRYVAEVTVSGELDPLGRVIDFSVLKSVVGKWIDDNWDHNMLLHPDDPLVCFVMAPAKAREMGIDPSISERVVDNLFAGKEPYIFPRGSNPTAENIAKELGQKAIELLKPYHIEVSSIRVYETPNCWADWTNVVMLPEYEG